ncbi:unnamed protein product, partial [Coregonus sp. 'balchen']
SQRPGPHARAGLCQTQAQVSEGLSSHLPVQQQRKVIYLSLQQWAEEAPLSFQEDPTSPGAEIEIRHHLGCPLLFDGPGGEVAHTAQPGQIHLDDEVYSVFPSNHRVNLLQVLLHETGHVLGLPHLSSPNSVMHSLYPNDSPMEMGWEDRKAIQQLYGQCEGSFDTFWSSSDLQDSDGQLISQGFPGITRTLDTATFHQQHRLVSFFKGHQVGNFVNIIGNLDAVYFSYTPNAMFFIKGLQYWEVSRGGSGGQPFPNTLLHRKRVADQLRDLCTVLSSPFCD